VPRQADTLVVADEVGADRGMDAVAFRLQHGAQEGTGAALAIGSGNMEHRRQAQVRIA